MLINGINEANPDLVRKAIDSGRVKQETLNVGLAAALVKANDEIIELLKNAGAMPPPAVAAETLESYAGKYKGTNGPEVEIAVKEGRLFVTPAGQQQISLWPLDQRRFQPIALDGATITFNVEDGKTVGLTFTQDDHSMELRRV